jgi:hypothetical protein
MQADIDSGGGFPKLKHLEMCHLSARNAQRVGNVTDRPVGLTNNVICCHYSSNN